MMTPGDQRPTSPNGHRALSPGGRPSRSAAPPEPTHRITAFALGAAALLALAPPITWYQAGRERIEAQVEAHATMTAAVVSDGIARNPDLWRFEEARLRSLLSLGEAAEPEYRRVMTEDGEIVAELAVRVPGPLIADRRPLSDLGRTVGWVEVRRSLLPLIRETALVGLLSLALAAATFLALRLVPMRLLRRAVAHAAHVASHDTLTGLPNRALLNDRLRQAAVAYRRRGNGTLAVLCLDLDRFKEVNDALGHAAGDRLLEAAALRLAACVRGSDTLARLGGDEFAIVQEDAPQPAGAAALAGRIIAAFDAPFEIEEHRVTVGISVGIAVAEPPESADPARLIQEADLALYDVKGDGRNGYRFFASHMNATLQARRALEADLRGAMDTGGLRLNFQPLVDLDTRETVGAEALLRWQHPVRGNVPPDAFIGLAERTGLIVPIGAWVLEEACRQAMTWERPLKVAVNVSPVQFRDPSFFGTVCRTLADTGLPASRLELEVTESLLLADTDEVLNTLERLHGMGIAIAMDDFGTGYSSLGTLHRFRFDKVKIDRGFIRHLGDNPRAAAIVRAIVGMTDALGIRTNAEGVETEEQAARLREEGCVEVQGWLFGRPQEAADFARSARRVPELA